MGPDYSEEDAQEILRRALEEKGAQDPRFSHDELKKAAEEIGVGADQFEAAALAIRDEREASKNLSQTWLKKRDKFFRRAGFFLIASAFLYLLFGTSAWFTYPVGLMGFFLALRAFRTFFPESKQRRSAELQQEVLRVRELRALRSRQEEERLSRQRERALAKKSRANFWAALEQLSLAVLRFVNQGRDSNSAPRKDASAPSPRADGTAPRLRVDPRELDPKEQGFDARNPPEVEVDESHESRRTGSQKRTS